jgi:hypothetical protein
MSLTIKSIVVNRNNLALLGQSQINNNRVDSSSENKRSSVANRLKSLDQERKIKKIKKMIDSPSHEACKLSFIKKVFVLKCWKISVVFSSSTRTSKRVLTMPKI